MRTFKGQFNTNSLITRPTVGKYLCVPSLNPVESVAAIVYHSCFICDAYFHFNLYMTAFLSTTNREVTYVHANQPQIAYILFRPVL